MSLRVNLSADIRKRRSASTKRDFFRPLVGPHRSKGDSAPTIESLEGRRLFAVGAYLNAGNLIAYGDTGADTITFSGTGNSAVVVKFNGVQFGSPFIVTSGHTITAYGYGGNDFISVATGSGIGPIVAYGGDGDDSIEGCTLGGDFLYGDSGADTLDGNGGGDHCYGGIGNDLLHGRSGADTLFGEAGNDTFDGLTDGSNDYVDGGADSDSVVGGHDSSDTLIGIEFP